MKNIRNIIKEEMDEFQWIRDIKPNQYGNFNIGDRFIVPDSKPSHRLEMVYTISSVNNDTVTVTWYDGKGGMDYSVSVVNEYLKDGTWKLLPNDINEQDEFEWIRDIPAKMTVDNINWFFNRPFRYLGRGGKYWLTESDNPLYISVNWMDYDYVQHMDYKKSDTVNYFREGSWVFDDVVLKEQDDMGWIRDIPADPIRPYFEKGYDTVVIDIKTQEEYRKTQEALIGLNFFWRDNGEDGYGGNSGYEVRYLSDVPTLLYIREDQPLTRAPYGSSYERRALDYDEILIDNPFL